VDEEFFSSGRADAGGEEDSFRIGQVKSNFLCNLGYGDGLLC
jgi:3-hydroxypropanoate dehydrogenase